MVTNRDSETVVLNISNFRGTVKEWDVLPLYQFTDNSEADTGFFKRGGRGLSRVWIFHPWTFCSGTYHTVHGQNVGGQNTGGQNASQNCKAILWDREGKMAILSKDFIYDTDGQVN